jgi:soluble lytic murein transglycosylase-like protein
LSSEAGLSAGSTLMIPPQGAGAPVSERAVGETSSTPAVGETSSTPAVGETSSTPEATGESGAESGAGDSDGDSDDSGSTPEMGAGTAGPSAAQQSAYVVQPGDTLSAIAERAGSSVAELATANGLNPSEPLLSGAVLNLPGAATQAAGASPVAASPTEASTVAASQPEGSAAEGSAGGPPFPTAQSVSPSEVGSIAAENGVPPSFAQAIAQQESGFNNEVTSSAGAQGEMQILPGTWNWINENLTPSSPLEPASASSNVRGGVLLLHSLLESSGGNPGTAAAGYFQGLGSVTENGELPETQQYVESVLSLQHQFGG